MDAGALPTRLQIQGTVLAKAKQQQELEGQAAVSLIDAAAQSTRARPLPPHLGRHVDVRA